MKVDDEFEFKEFDLPAEFESDEELSRFRRLSARSFSPRPIAPRAIGPRVNAPRPRPRPRPLPPRWPKYPPPPIGRRTYLYAPESPAASEYVRWVQTMLNQALNLQLPVDGVMGPETRSAIRSFQEKNGLPADGIVGPPTEAALIAATKGQPPPAQDTASEFEAFDFEADASEWESEVNRSRRDYIKWVQQSVNQIMGLRLAVDGDLGPQTRSAIRSFQQQQGLAVDGKAGPKTEGAIKAALGGSPGPTSPSGIGFLGTVPSFPAKPAGSPRNPSPLPVPLFPPKPADPLTTDPKMETALWKAIEKTEKDRKLAPGTFPIPFTIVDVTSGSGSFPSAGYLETVTDYIASEAKVSVMYSAYALRDMVRRLAASSVANMVNLPTRLIKDMNPAIINAFNKIKPSFIMDVHRVPSYPNVFVIKPAEEGGLHVTVDFTPAFDKALERMIVPSDNAAAAICVHGVGYGYLNGALAAGGFFDPSSAQGLWVGGDFQGGKKWPYERIFSRNDFWVAQAGTTRDMAKLVSLIMTDRLLDPVSCSEMRGRLARTVGVDPPWIARTGIFKSGTITHNKLGLGPLKSGRNVRSEVSVYQSPVAKGRRYVVAWQNLVGLWPIGFADIAKIIKATITEFEQ